jgi:hypothetical protein
MAAGDQDQRGGPQPAAADADRALPGGGVDLYRGVIYVYIEYIYIYIYHSGVDLDRGDDCGCVCGVRESTIERGSERERARQSE